MTKFLEAESLDDFVNQGLETKKDEVAKEKFDMSWNYIYLKNFWRPKKKERMAHMGDVKILWDWMGDVRKMERLEKHLCLGFLFGKTMKRIWRKIWKYFRSRHTWIQWRGGTLHGAFHTKICSVSILNHQIPFWNTFIHGPRGVKIN